MLKDLKAIETVYSGCKFRSRLEARWAVFFNFLGINWEYEPEGYSLEKVGGYLPDFWLPEMECFFEVKGPAPTEYDVLKAKQLSIESGYIVILASGQISTKIISVGKADWEWPSNGFNLSLFAGNFWDTWVSRLFNFGHWNYLLDKDLPPFIKDQFPNELIPSSPSSERRRKLAELDKQYYRNKYNREHPRYVNGRYEKSVNWVLSNSNGFGFSLEPDDCLTEISKAYEKARMARFEHGQKG